jgi:integrase
VWLQWGAYGRLFRTHSVRIPYGIHTMKAIHTKSGRDGLGVKREPHWRPLTKGRALGFRKTGYDTTTRDSVGSWIARYRVEAGGHEYKALGDYSETFGHDDAVRAAEAWFKVRDEGVTGKADDGKPITIAIACREYIEDRKREKGKATADAAARFFERRVYGVMFKNPKPGREWKHAADPLAAVRLEKIRSKDLQHWRERCVAAGLSRDSVNREMTTLRAALNLAVRNRLVGADKAREWAEVKKFRNVAKRRDLYLDLGQRRALLAAATGAVRDLIEAAMWTGARAGELVAARRSAFDARTRTLTLSSAKSGSRTVTLVAPSALALFGRLAEGKLPMAWLLTRDDGKPWGHSDWDELVRDATAAAKLPDGACLYTLRHSWITQAITDGMSPLEVARLVGTSLRMIDSNYGHLALATTHERLAKLTMA